MQNIPNTKPAALANTASQQRLQKNESYYLELFLLAAIGVPFIAAVVYTLGHIVAGSAVLGSPAVLYLALPALILVLSFAVVFLPNPMHALLSLIGVFLGTVFCYLALGAEFLGLVFLIVYVGAVAILFIFVIMLLNVKSLTQKAPVEIQGAQLLGSVLAILLVKIAVQELVPSLAYQITANSRVPGMGTADIQSTLVYNFVYQAADIHTFATLYTRHSGLFVIITLILLVAMIGAIVLATTTLEGESEARVSAASGIAAVAPRSVSQVCSPQGLFTNLPPND